MPSTTLQQQKTGAQVCTDPVLSNVFASLRLRQCHLPSLNNNSQLRNRRTRTHRYAKNMFFLTRSPDNAIYTTNCRTEGGKSPNNAIYNTSAAHNSATTDATRNRRTGRYAQVVCNRLPVVSCPWDTNSLKFALSHTPHNVD